MKPIRLLLVEDLDRVRCALRAMLESEPEFEVIGEASDGEAALALARQYHPDMILMDLALPRIDGVDAIRSLREEGCTARVVVLTLYGERREQAQAAGADLFLEKGITPDALIGALEAVAAGPAH